MSTSDAEDASPSPEHSGDEDENDMADDKQSRLDGDSTPPQANNDQKPNAKDPSRPRRKKARRACLACQRAHLTCGDERPCQRCIKRGLQDACQDGVRKKAKYLHDAPAEALLPGVAGNYPRHMNGTQSSLPGGVSVPSSNVAMAHQASFYPQSQNAGFAMYSQNSNEAQMAPPIQEPSSIGQFGNQQTPISPPYTHHSASQSTPPIPNSIPQVSQGAQQLHGFGGHLFDPSDPALFNFDISSLNFGSTYGALEFGMLGHISGAAADTPPHDSGMMGSIGQSTSVFQPSGANPSQISDGPHLSTTMQYGPETMAEWQNANSRQNSIVQIQTAQNTPITSSIDGPIRHDSFPGPYAYTIGAGPSSLSSASPASTGHDANAGYEPGSVSPAFFHANQHQTLLNRQAQAQQASNFALQPVNPNVGPRKRRRDTRAIYEDLKQPYPYTQAFHRLQKLLQQRLPSNKVVRVAKAMAAIRPTFIACMKDLDEQDLLHQERTFQRKLWSYQNWLEYMGTPTLVIRRSGEVAAVGKEFCILSGWRKDVLLGKEPNLNVNWDSSPGQSSGTSSRGASTTPRISTQEEAGRPQPVFLAELLDSDSVVQFYEDFARLAFGDARGAVERRCRVMKYRTKLEDDNSSETNGINHREDGARKKQKTSHKLKSDSQEINVMGSSEKSLIRLEQDSVECMMGWTCWHDQFDMPAMIVMNFLPILHPTLAEPERVRMGAQPPPR